MQGGPYANAKGCNTRGYMANCAPGVRLREERGFCIGLFGCISAQSKYKSGGGSQNKKLVKCHSPSRVIGNFVWKQMLETRRGPFLVDESGR